MAPTSPVGAPLAALNSKLEPGRQSVAVAVAGEAMRVVLASLDQMRALQHRAALELGAHPFDAGWGLRYWMDLAGLVAETQSELAACGLRLVDADDLFAGARLVHA